MAAANVIILITNSNNYAILYVIVFVEIVGEQIAIALNTGYYLFAMPREYKEIDKISIENSKQRVQEIVKFAQKLEDAINGRRENNI